jgi:putative ABC transport system ATP-binding protein
VTVEALRGVNLEIPRGAFACVVGRSGSGKSTLLNLLGCLDRPDQGRIYLDGVEVTRLGEQERVKLRRTRLGIVFQSLNLLPSLSALENVALPLKYGRVPRPERIGRARGLLERVGLADRLDFLPDQMSGGEQQRVALARALVARPLLVLADEPTGELDSATAAEVEALFRDLNRENETTFVVVTHDEALSSRADSVFRMVDGRIEN